MTLADATSQRVANETVSALAMEFGALSQAERTAFRSVTTNLYRVGACIESSSVVELKNDKDLRDECAIYVESIFCNGAEVCCALSKLSELAIVNYVRCASRFEDIPMRLREIANSPPAERPPLITTAFLMSLELYLELVITSVGEAR